MPYLHLFFGILLTGSFFLLYACFYCKPRFKTLRKQHENYSRTV